MKEKYRKNGDCCFYVALLGTVILLSLLFILGVPKFVIALEYWDQCPLSPLVPLYLCLTGVLGVACVGHSAFLWACLYRRHMKKKASHDSCLVLWVFLMLSVPIAQLIGAPYIIHTYHKKHASDNRTMCDITNFTVLSSDINQSSTALPRNVGMTIGATNTTDIHYVVNPKFSGKSNPSVTSQNEQSDQCLDCNSVLLTCAYVTAIFEVTFMTLPMVCLVLASVAFRIRNKELSK